MRVNSVPGAKHDARILDSAINENQRRGAASAAQGKNTTPAA